jgi:hypothetical protein
MRPDGLGGVEVTVAGSVFRIVHRDDASNVSSTAPEMVAMTMIAPSS